MKFTRPHSRITGQLASTITELLMSMALFTVILGGLLAVNMFCAKYDEMTNAQMGASDTSRNNFSVLMNELRSGKNVQIGSGTYSNFVAVTNGLEIGDTIQIIPTTNLNLLIYYYFLTNAPTNSGWLVRVATTNNNGTTTILQSNVMAQWLTNMYSTYMTNAMLFTAADYTGTNILTVNPTNYTHNYTVSAHLQFYQYRYPITYVGSNALFSYYQIQFLATRRNP